MSENILKIEIIPNGYLYFEPIGSVSDSMKFVATVKRNSSQDAKVADWFEGTKKQGQSRDFESVKYTALAASDAVNGGRDKWKVFRAIENYQKAHNLTLTVKPKGQNKGSYNDLEALSRLPQDEIVGKFQTRFGISKKDWEQKVTPVGGSSIVSVTLNYKGKQYSGKGSDKRGAQYVAILDFLEKEYGITTKSEREAQKAEAERRAAQERQEELLDETKYLRVLSERSDVEVKPTSWINLQRPAKGPRIPANSFLIDTPYGKQELTDSDISLTMIKGVKVSEEEREAYDQRIEDDKKSLINEIEQRIAHEKEIERLELEMKEKEAREKLAREERRQENGGLNAKLENAVKSDNLEEVKSLIKEGAQISNAWDKKEDFENTLLIALDAVPINQDMVNYLIDHGAKTEFETYDYDGELSSTQSLLCSRIEDLDVDAVRALVVGGADIWFQSQGYSGGTSIDNAIAEIEERYDDEYYYGYKETQEIMQIIKDAREGNLEIHKKENVAETDAKENTIIENSVSVMTDASNEQQVQKSSTIEFVGAMDNPHFMDRHFNKEAMTIGSKPLPLASEDEMRQIMETMDKEALRLAQEQGADGVIYLSMALDHNIATDAVAPLDCVDKGKVFTIIRDANTPYEKEVRVALVSKEDMQKEAATNLIHAIYGPDEGKMVNYTAFFGAMSEPFPRELDKDATPEQIARNEKCKEYWDNHVFLATPEEVQKVVQDLQTTAAKTEDKDKAQKYTTTATAASMRVNLFKNMGKKSPLTAKFHSEKADYEISVPQPKTGGNSRNGKGIGE